MHAVFTFPETVNEYAARVVAAGVVAMCAALIATQSHWIVVPLAYGFVARVLSGPMLSPLGQLATRVLVPRLGLPNLPTSGRPKRFAQAIGATLSVAALAAWVVGYGGVTMVLAGMIMVAASLEAAFGFCIGCRIFRALIKTGFIAEDVCLECADITSHLEAKQAELAGNS